MAFTVNTVTCLNIREMYFMVALNIPRGFSFVVDFLLRFQDVNECSLEMGQSWWSITLNTNISNNFHLFGWYVFLVHPDLENQVIDRVSIHSGKEESSPLHFPISKVSFYQFIIGTFSKFQRNKDGKFGRENTIQGQVHKIANNLNSNECWRHINTFDQWLEW